MKKCKIIACEEVAKIRGYCRSHYKQAMQNGVIKSTRLKGVDRYCTFEDCDKPHKGKGYCRGHLSQLTRGKKLTPLQVRYGLPSSVIRMCSFEGCERPHSAKDFCKMHYGRYCRGTLYGSPKQEQLNNAIEDCMELLSFGVTDIEELWQRAGFVSLDAMRNNLSLEQWEKVKMQCLS